jgi:cell division transport system permease protein
MSFTAKSAYFWRTAFRSMWRSPFVHVIAVATLTIALSSYGLARLAEGQVEQLLAALGTEVEMTVYLADGAPEDKAQQLLVALEQSTGGKARLVSPDEALLRLRKQLGPQGEALSAVEKNPLPWSLEVTVPPGARTPASLKALAERARGLELVAGVDWGEAAVERLSAIARALRLGSLVVFTIVFLTSVVVVSATLQLVIYARREEIEIQKLVGGTNAFVRAPFLIEGVLQGLVAAALSLGLLAALGKTLGPRAAELLAFLRAGRVSPEAMARVAMELVALGVGMGLLGSIVAVKRFLRA